MFKDQSLFVMIENDNEDNIEIKRIETTKVTQQEICEHFNKATKALIGDKESVIFNGSYKPESDEFLVIESFDLSNDFYEAITNPVGVSPFIPNKQNPQNIKAIFMGEKKKIQKKEQLIISFQKFRKEQYISRMGLNLFHNKDTFITEKRFGFSINDNVDCVFEGNQLKFSSFYFARQIFELSQYYREATDKDVANFISHKAIHVEDVESFNMHADSWVRRKIAIITDSGFLDKHSVSKIKLKAKDFGLSISSSRNKLNFPDDKKELKKLLKFLDDEIYKGVFSEEILQTNSKRKAEM